jgi:hypothetical protein
MRHIVTAILILVAIATTVHAECAWILWEKLQLNDIKENKTKESDTMPWSAKTGTPSLLLCLQTVESIVAKEANEKKKGILEKFQWERVAGETFMSITIGTLEIRSWYRCLPDTIKPET